MRQCFIPYPVIIRQSWTALLTVQNFAKAPRLIEAMSLITLITCNELPSQDVWHRGGRPEKAARHAVQAPPGKGFSTMLPHPFSLTRLQSSLDDATETKKTQPDSRSLHCLPVSGRHNEMKVNRWLLSHRLGEVPGVCGSNTLLSSPPPLGAQCWNTTPSYLKGSPERND